MDRREALKKVGAGGAALVGTSLVISSPVFAFAAPTVTGAPTITLTKDNASTATIGASGFPEGSCPESATNLNDVPSRGTPTYSWTDPGGGPDGSGTAVTSTINWATGTVVTVTVTVAYTCLYTPPNSTTQSYSWSQPFTSGGNGGSGVFTPGTISGPTPV